LHQVLDPERIGAEHVALLAILEVTEQSVDAVREPHLADAGQPLVGGELAKGEVAPGAAHHHEFDIGDLHIVAWIERCLGYFFWMPRRGPWRIGSRPNSWAPRSGALPAKPSLILGSTAPVSTALHPGRRVSITGLSFSGVAGRL